MHLERFTLSSCLYWKLVWQLGRVLIKPWQEEPMLCALVFGGLTLLLLWSSHFLRGQGVSEAFVDPGIPCPNDPSLPACTRHFLTSPWVWLAPLPWALLGSRDGQGMALCGKWRLWKELPCGIGESHAHLGVSSLCVTMSSTKLPGIWEA